MLNFGILTLVALSKGPVIYQWGKDVEYDTRLNAIVSDCSGYVRSTLYDVGIMLPDMTSQGIYNWCLRQKGSESSKTCDSLLFFGKSKEEITHIAISIDGEFMIEVAGGNEKSLQMSKEELILKNARSRIRRIDSRSDFIAGIKIPFKKGS